MNPKKLLLTGLVALAVAAVGAQAQVISGLDSLSSAFDGDLVLGVRNASATNDLVIDLGSYSQFHGLTAGTTYTLTDVKSADFISTFGANVFTNAGTTWTVFGGVGTSGSDLTPKVTNGTLWGSTPWTSGTFNTLARSNSQQATSNDIDAFTSSLSGGTSLSGNGAQNIPVGPGSFTTLIRPTNNFGYFQVGIEASTVGTSKLELFELAPGTGAGIDLGTFTLTSSGLTFTAFQAIPEPSTYAMILGVATLGFAAIRRRKQAQLLA